MSDNSPPADLSSAFAYCESLLRDHDRVGWLAILFAPEASRSYLHAIYAYACELRRIRAIVSEPAIGEIRLQWWIEALRGERATEAAAHPVSAALLETITRFGLPREALVNLAEARRFDLYNDPMPSLHDLEGYCGETVSILFQLAGIIACDGADAGGAEASGHAGVALGITHLLQNLPAHGSRGQCYLPKDVVGRNGALQQAAAAGLTTEPLCAALAEMRAVIRKHLAAARGALGTMDARARPAFVLLSQVEPILKQMERRGYDPFASPIELPQWRSQWAMWRW